MSFEITIANGKVWLYESYEVNDNSFMQQFDCIMDAEDARKRLTCVANPKTYLRQKPRIDLEERLKNQRNALLYERKSRLRLIRRVVGQIKWKWQA